MDKQTQKRILVADDEKPLARALTLKLEHAGFFVKSVGDGEEVLLELKKDSKYDFLLLDLVMPKKDGFVVLEEMKKDGIKIQTVVLSNLIQEEDKKKVKSLGVEIFIEKANTPIADIVEKVQSILKN